MLQLWSSVKVGIKQLCHLQWVIKNPTSFLLLLYFFIGCVQQSIFSPVEFVKSKPCISLNCHSHIHCFLLQIVIVPPVTHFLPGSRPRTHLHTCTHKNKSLKYTHHRGWEHAHCETQCCSHTLAHPHTHTSRKYATYTHNRGPKHKQSAFWQFSLKCFVEVQQKNTPV